MPDPTFIPGHLGTVLLNADDISAIGSVVKLNLSRAQLPKPTFGQAYAFSLGGQRSGTFSAQGHVSAEQLADLVAMFNVEGVIAFSLQIGEGLGVTDAGLFTGNCSVSSFGIEGDAAGEWDWSIDAATSGAVDYTPPTP